jgi:hypothetical protein
MPPNGRHRRVPGAGVKDAPADGARVAAASVLSVAAPLRAGTDFGSKVPGYVIARAASAAFLDKMLVSAGQRMLYSAAIWILCLRTRWKTRFFELVP